MKQSLYIIRYRKRKNEIFLFVCILLFMWILMAYNTSSADIGYYSNMFNRIKAGVTYHAVEGGFYFLCKLAVLLGMEYSCFLKLYSAVALLLIASTVIKYAKKPWLVLIVYFCYPFILDIAQIRHFMAVAIFTYAIRYLEKFSRKNMVFYCILILIATTQHVLAFGFLIFLLAYISDKKKIIKISILFMLAMFVGQRLLFSTWIYRSIIGLRDADIDYSAGISIGMFLQYSLFYAILLGLCLYLDKIKKIENDISFKIAMLSSIFIPLLLIDFQFTRFFRGSILMVYIYILNRIYSLKKEYNRFGYVCIFMIFMITVFVLLFGPSSGYFETMTRPIFYENGLIGVLFEN